MGKDYSWNINVHNKVLICDSYSSKPALGLSLFNHGNDDALFFPIPQAVFSFDYMEKEQKSYNESGCLSPGVRLLKISLCNFITIVNCGSTG